MKSILLGAAAVAALTTFGASADAQPKPRFPIHRTPVTQPAALPTAAPAQAAAQTPVEAEPMAAPAGEVEGTALPSLEPAPAPAETAAPASEPESPSTAPPVITLASATTVAAQAAPAAATPVYTMQSGDTLMGVTRRFKTTLSRLRALNDLAVDASIKAGQKIRLPADSVDTGAEPFAKGPAPVMTAAPRRAEPSRPALARATPPPPAAMPRTAERGGAAPVLARPATPPPVQAAVTTPPPSSTATPGPVATAPVVAAATPVVAAPPPVARAITATPPPPVAASVPAAAASAAAAIPTDPVTAGRGRFVWPVRGEVISPFGPKGPGQRNDGLNIAAQEGDPVQAAAEGEVVYAGDQVPGFGKLVLIKHDGGWVTAYAHLSEIGVKMKDRVDQGGEIGKAGRTGAVTSPQLHFEVRYAPTAKDKARPVDPMPLLPR